MNAVKFVIVAVVIASAATARGQAPPRDEQFPVGVLVVPNQPIEIVRPNVFDPFHPKILRFHGNAGGGVDPAELTVFFDWLDLSGAPTYSPPTTIPVPPHAFLPLDLEYTIPFCPQLVSLDLRAAGGPIEVAGVFSHECVPEPSSLVAMGTGSLVLAWATVRNRRRSRFDRAAVR